MGADAIGPRHRAGRGPALRENPDAAADHDSDSAWRGNRRRGSAAPTDGGAAAQRSCSLVAVEPRERVMRRLVGRRLGGVVVAGVQEEDGDAAAAVVDPPLGLVSGAVGNPCQTPLGNVA